MELAKNVLAAYDNWLLYEPNIFFCFALAALIFCFWQVVRILRRLYMLLMNRIKTIRVTKKKRQRKAMVFHWAAYAAVVLWVDTIYRIIDALAARMKKELLRDE